MDKINSTELLNIEQLPSETQTAEEATPQYTKINLSDILGKEVPKDFGSKFMESVLPINPLENIVNDNLRFLNSIKPKAPPPLIQIHIHSPIIKPK